MASSRTASRSSNPFVGKPGRDEIYALGLRNPFRFSFDRRAHRDRRRRPGQLGGGRLRGPQARFAARTSAGTTSRAPPAPLPRRQRGAAAQAPLPPPDLRVRAHESNCGGGAARSSAAYVVRDPALGSPARALPLRGLLQGRRSAAWSRTAPGRGATARSASTSTTRARSATAPTGHVYVTSLDGPVYRLDSPVATAGAGRVPSGMERATASPQRPAGSRQRSRPPTAPVIDVHSPADGSLDPPGSRSTRPSAWPRSSPASAPRSPSGRRSESPAAVAGSSAFATG